ncbi:MAG: phosphatase PAP2 family protein [Thermoleophilaceae bacterium]|nr:phosphatase PAP2 family protein [Thermoleophilaceae bacterium]
MDHPVVHALNQLFLRHDALEDPVVAYVNVSAPVFAAVLVVLFVAARGSARHAARRVAVAAAASAGVALLVANVLAGIVDRARPFAADPRSVHLFSHHAADPGFPSDHATGAFAIAVAIFLRHRRLGSLLLVAAALLSVGRVAMGVHWPTDVIAGAALGAATAIALDRGAVRRALDRVADVAGRVLDHALGRVLGSTRA